MKFVASGLCAVPERHGERSLQEAIVIAQADLASIGPLLEPYRAFWADCFKQATGAANGIVEAATGAAINPRAWQRRWLEAVRASMDAYLRSPTFLRAMKQNMDMIIKTKLQADDFAKEFARNANLPTASDVTGLFERLRSLEEEILSRLTEIDRRLATIESTGKSQSSA